MVEPVALQDFFIAFFSGAMVIVCGALYALLFAWSRIRGELWAMTTAYAFYVLLVISVLTLADALHLTGFWISIVIVMLVGYLLAPHGIWVLCVNTHSDDADT